jgi:hypothetical protein
MKLQIEITRRDFLEFNEYHFLKFKLKTTVITSFIVLLGLLLILNNENFNLLKTIAGSLIYVLLFFSIIKINLWETFKTPNENGEILGEKEIEITEESIQYNSKNTQTKRNWYTILFFKESQGAFYLYTDSVLAIVIPKRYFKNENDMYEFRKIVNENIEINSY